MDNQLTSLLKKKYGTTTSSPVIFTDKDTLYTSFRKLADNIYKNGSWTKEDEVNAVDTMIRNRNGLPLDDDLISMTSRDNTQWQVEVSIEPVENLKELEEHRLQSQSAGKVAYLATVHRKEMAGEGEKVKQTYFFLDPQNKVGKEHGEFYYFPSEDGTSRTYYALGNMNRGIGYDKLQRDILREFVAKEEKLPFEKRELERLLEKLSNATYSGKSNMKYFTKKPYGELTDAFLATLPRDESELFQGNPSRVQEMVQNNEVNEENREWIQEQLATSWGDLSDDPDSQIKVNLDRSPYILKNEGSKTFLYPRQLEIARQQNQIIDFVENYMQTTYDIFLQREYEKDIDKQTRAAAWQTKKNINKEVQKVMESTSLNRYFDFVEIDNDVDLKLFNQFEKEMERIHAVLPKTGDKIPELRLRKLGNHKALGLYVPSKNTIAVDFRDRSDSIEGVGIQSFVHEYGHALDYGINNGQLLSMEESFQPIVSRYRENLGLFGKGSYVASKAGYYTTPTEVFARAFELYVSDAGLSSIFLKPKDTYKSSLEYTLFDSELRKKLTSYFDKAFPELKQAIGQKNNEMDLSNKMIKEVMSLQFVYENVKIEMQEALENIEFFLLDQKSAIEYQEEEVEKYKNPIRPSEVYDDMVEMLEKQLKVLKNQPEDTLFLFDSAELVAYSTNTKEIVELITENDDFRHVYKVEPSDMIISDLKTAISEPNKTSMDLSNKVINEVKSLKFVHEKVEIEMGEALENCELSLLDQKSAIEWQKAEVQKYRQAIPRTEVMEQITVNCEEQLEEIRSQPEETMFLFDGAELSDYSASPQEIVQFITERNIFEDVYGVQVSDIAFPDNFILQEDTLTLSNHNNLVKPEEEIIVVADKQTKEEVQPVETVNEEQIASLLDDSLIPTEETPLITEEVIQETSDPNKHYYIQEINYTFEEVRQETEEFLKKAISQEEQYISSVEIKNMLDEHLDKVETTIQQCMEAIEQLTEEQVQEETTKMKKKIGNILSDFKKNIQNYLTNQKNNAFFKVTNTRDNIVQNFRNAFNRRMLTINGQLKKLSMKIDSKFALEDKKALVEEGTKSTNEEIKAPEEKEETKETEIPQETKDIKTPVDKQGAAEEKNTPETTNESVESQLGAEQPTSNKKSELAHVPELEKIEKLSKQLGLEMKDKDRQEILNLSDKEKEGLIHSLETAVEEKNQSVSTDEVDLEVG